MQTMAFINGILSPFTEGRESSLLLCDAESEINGGEALSFSCSIILLSLSQID